MEIQKAPKVSISAREHHKILRWVDLCKYEISGLGLVDKVPGGYHVTEVFLLTQEVSGSETELDEMAIAKLQWELSQREEGLQDKLRFWWHSHVNMGVFWSNTDEEAISSLVGDLHLISSVFNKPGLVKTRVDMGFGNFRTKWDDLPLEVISGEDDIASFANSVLDKLKPTKSGTYGVNQIIQKTIELLGIGRIPNAFKDDKELESFCKEEFKEKVTATTWVNHWQPQQGKNKRLKQVVGRASEEFIEYYDSMISPLHSGLGGFDLDGFDETPEDVAAFMERMRWKK